MTETINHPPANATIVMQVDESQRRWDVRLPSGISLGSKRLVISLVTYRFGDPLGIPSMFPNLYSP